MKTLTGMTSFVGMLSSQNTSSQKAPTSLSRCEVAQPYPSRYWGSFGPTPLHFKVNENFDARELASGLSKLQVKSTSAVIPLFSHTGYWCGSSSNLVYGTTMYR